MIRGSSRRYFSLFLAVFACHWVISAVEKPAVLVRFRPGLSAERRDLILEPYGRRIPLLSAKDNRFAARGAAPDDMAGFSPHPNVNFSQALAALRHHPQVLYAEPNYRVSIYGAAGLVLPDDFDFDKLWGLHSATNDGPDIRASKAWEITKGSRSVTVAVIDTGIDYHHEDLASNIWRNAREIPHNGADDDNNGFVDDIHGYDFCSGDSDPFDDHGHGTHVAGTIGALGNNEIGVAGVCWEVSLLAIKAFNENGDGRVSDAIAAIRYAVSHGARIINASWGLDDESQALADAVTEAINAGVLFVAAGGNSNQDTATYPAAIPGVVAVAALNKEGRRASFSNHGPYIAVAAPGESIFSTVPNNGYRHESGTSMAAPHVAGIAALLLAQRPAFTRGELANILTNQVDPIVTDKWTGAGRVNAHAAVQVQAPLPLAGLLRTNILAGRIQLSGTAAGPDFQHYILEFSPGLNPTNWIEIFRSSSPVTNGLLLSQWDTSTYNEGPCSIRLSVFNSRGFAARARLDSKIENVQLAAPQGVDILRAGEVLAVEGFVNGRGRRYQLEYAAGIKSTNWQPIGAPGLEPRVGTDNLRSNEADPHPDPLPKGEGRTMGGNAQILDLGQWATKDLRSNEFYALRLTATDTNRQEETRLSSFLYLDANLKKGWPRHVPLPAFVEEDWRTPQAADLDQDGFQEILLVQAGASNGFGAELRVYDFQGGLKWRQPLPQGVPFTDIPVAGDLDGDGKLEVLVEAGARQQVFAFRSDGAPLGGKWPVTLDSGNAGKALADLDQDGKLELICYGNLPIEHNGQDRQVLAVYNAAGDLLSEWFIPYAAPDENTVKKFPVIANLDSDAGLEIVGVYGWDQLAAFDLTKAQEPLWITKAVDGYFVTSPVAGDLDQDGWPEFIIGSKKGSLNFSGGILKFDHLGQLAAGWPVLPEENFSSPAVLADIDDDGYLEIIACNWTDSKLHLLSRHGFEMPGWPVAAFQKTGAKSIPAAGDIDGDGGVDIILVSLGSLGHAFLAEDYQALGGVRAWSRQGSEIDLNSHPELRSLFMETAGGARWKASPVVLTDLDNNGKLDVIAASIQDAVWSLDGAPALKDRSSIYVWELPVKWAPRLFPWPAFHQNIAHTGHIPTIPRPQPILTNLTAVDDFAIALEETPIVIAPLENDWPRPGQARLIRCSTPTHGRLETTNTLIMYWPEEEYYGRDSFQYTIQDSSGATSTATIHLMIKPWNDAPRATNQYITFTKNKGGDIFYGVKDAERDELTFKVVQAPAHGELWTYPSIASYYPHHNYVGYDFFTYTSSDKTSTSGVTTVFLTIVDTNNPPSAYSNALVTRQNRGVKVSLSASDPDQEQLSYLITSQPGHGTVEQTEGSAWFYKPEKDFVGEDSFRFRATDGRAQSEESSIQINVTDQNTAPRADEKTLRVTTNQDLTFELSGADSEGDPLVFEILAAPKHGQIEANGAKYTFKPAPGFQGPDRFKFRAGDGGLWSEPATARVLVAPPNGPPQASVKTVLVTPGFPVSFTLSLTDPNDDSVAPVILKGPQHGVLAQVGAAFTYTTAPSFDLEDQFTFKGWDGKTYGAEGKIILKHASPPEPPRLFKFSSIQARPGGLVAFELNTVFGKLYTIQISDDLVNWRPFTNDLALTNSIRWTLTNQSDGKPRFFRAVEQP